MRTTHLHAARGDIPNGFAEIELGPLGKTQFARPGKQQGHQFQRRHRAGLAFKGVDGAEQRSKPLPAR